MKIPLVYPKIYGTKNFPCKSCIAFEKVDGTNLHVLWEKNKGWVAFGTRRDRFNLDNNGIKEFNQEHPGLEDCIGLFEKVIKPLETNLLTKYNCKEAIVFTEYFGPNSFAGQHIPNDPKTIKMIDYMVDGLFLDPYQFISDFECVPIEYLPKVVYAGKYSGQLIEDIRTGKYDVNEGCVIKGVHNKTIHMAKIKTNNYLNRLK